MKDIIKEFNPEFILLLIPLCTLRMTTIMSDIYKILIYDPCFSQKYELILKEGYAMIYLKNNQSISSETLIEQCESKYDRLYSIKLPDGTISTSARMNAIKTGFDHYWRFHEEPAEWAKFGCPHCKGHIQAQNGNS